MPVQNVQSGSSAPLPTGEAVVQNETVGQAQVGGETATTDVQVVEGADAKPVDVVVKSSAEGTSISLKIDKSVLPPGSGGSQLESFIEQSGAKFAEQFGEAGVKAFGELAAKISANPADFMTDGKLDINKIKDAVIGTAVALGKTEVQSLEFVNQERGDLLKSAEGGVPTPSSGNPMSTRMGSGSPTTPNTSTRQGSGPQSTTPNNNTRQVDGSNPSNSTRQTDGNSTRMGSGGSGTTTIAESTSWAVLGDINTGDIEAMCFLVLMQAAKSAQEDLKAIMAKVKAINNAKAQQRKNLGEAQTCQALYANKTAGQSISGVSGFKPNFGKAELDPSPGNPNGFNNNATGYGMPTGDGHPTKQDMDAMVDTMKNDLDSMSEMGEMESLRLQMAMDRLSKMMSTLSNLLKKISDTSQSITQNLK